MFLASAKPGSDTGGRVVARHVTRAGYPRRSFPEALPAQAAQTPTESGPADSQKARAMARGCPVSRNARLAGQPRILVMA